jgi:hypothetical protein
LKLTFEHRPVYAFALVGGVVDAEDASSLRASARDRASRHDEKRVLVDLRDAELSREARDELLELARAPEAISIAFVTSDEMFLAEVNMASLAAGTRARAFPQHSEAHRWLSRGSILKTPFDLPKDHPRLSERPIGAEERRRALLEAPPRSNRPEPIRPTPRARPPERTENATPPEGTPRKR